MVCSDFSMVGVGRGRDVRIRIYGMWGFSGWNPKRVYVLLDPGTDQIDMSSYLESRLTALIDCVRISVRKNLSSYTYIRIV